MLKFTILREYKIKCINIQELGIKAIFIFLLLICLIPAGISCYVSSLSDSVGNNKKTSKTHARVHGFIVKKKYKFQLGEIINV